MISTKSNSMFISSKVIQSNEKNPYILCYDGAELRFSTSFHLWCLWDGDGLSEHVSGHFFYDLGHAGEGEGEGDGE